MGGIFFGPVYYGLNIRTQRFCFCHRCINPLVHNKRSSHVRHKCRPVAVLSAKVIYFPAVSHFSIQLLVRSSEKIFRSCSFTLSFLPNILQHSFRKSGSLSEQALQALSVISFRSCGTLISRASGSLPGQQVFLLPQP